MKFTGRAYLRTLQGLLLLLALLTLVLALVVIKNFVWVHLKQIKNEREVAAVRLKKEALSKEKEQELLFEVKQINVTLFRQPPKKNKILLLDVSLRTRSSAVYEFYKLNEAILKNTIIEMSAEFVESEIEGYDFKSLFKERLLARYSEVLGEKAPDSLFFSQFILQ